MENLSFLHDNLIILIKATLNESKGKNTDAGFSKRETETEIDKFKMEYWVEKKGKEYEIVIMSCNDFSLHSFI